MHRFRSTRTKVVSAVALSRHGLPWDVMVARTAIRQRRSWFSCRLQLLVRIIYRMSRQDLGVSMWRYDEIPWNDDRIRLDHATVNPTKKDVAIWQLPGSMGRLFYVTVSQRPSISLSCAPQMLQPTLCCSCWLNTDSDSHPRWKHRMTYEHILC